MKAKEFILKLFLSIDRGVYIFFQTPTAICQISRIVFIFSEIYKITRYKLHIFREEEEEKSHNGRGGEFPGSECWRRQVFSFFVFVFGFH